MRLDLFTGRRKLDNRFLTRLQARPGDPLHHVVQGPVLYNALVSAIAEVLGLSRPFTQQLVERGQAN